MFRAILFTQWHWTRAALVLSTIAGFTIPILSVQNVSRAALNQAQVGEVLNVQRFWGVAYPILAITIGLFIALGSWAADHRGRHVYPLSLPLPRWQYALMRLGAGLLLLGVPMAGVWLGAVIASAAVMIPPGLSAYPISLAARFALATLVAYSVFFAISAGTERTALYVLGTIGGLILAQVLLSMVSQNVFLDDVTSGVFQWAGPVDIYMDRWMPGLCT